MVHWLAPQAAPRETRINANSVPLVPILAVLASVYLMLNLPGAT